ncbi:hypothetical protein [Rhodohalobacter sp. SW132]|uniref:hypothetical protein n=1 Tax=Rhodohalobacter sp. SW132 TaxID=2293433 RepID=UPI0011C06EB5|nr:hypothetical protein [Rhodohalobacter sp. SW132]
MNKKNHKFISIVIATISAGIPIATVDAHQLNFTDPVFLLTWCLLGVVGSFGTYLYFNLTMRDMIGTFIVGYMLAVILRFVGDIVVNSVAHSNLTNTLFLAIGVGAAAGWIGSGLWILLKKSKRRKK